MKVVLIRLCGIDLSYVVLIRLCGIDLSYVVVIRLSGIDLPYVVLIRLCGIDLPYVVLIRLCGIDLPYVVLIRLCGIDFPYVVLIRLYGIDLPYVRIVSLRCDDKLWTTKILRCSVKRKPLNTLEPRNPSTLSSLKPRIPSTLSSLKPRIPSITSQTLSSQNEVNEEGTMVNTQTPITQTPEQQTPQTQTQKRKPRGITTMKSVVRERSNNKGDKLTVEWNARGQPLNNKGGNTLVSYIGVVVQQNISIKLNAAKDIFWKDITETFDVDEEHKDYIMKSAGKDLREFRTIGGNDSKMLKAMSTSSLQPNMQISLMKRIG
ncbi:hypothetical protein Lal_00012812 [Lupinus albus]|nr:hypothetical protein Lal_00012812 [Lupinus albus]